MKLNLPISVCIFLLILNACASGYSAMKQEPSCSGKMAKQNCEDFLSDPLKIGVKINETKIVERFGKPNSRKKVGDSKNGIGLKLIYSDKEIWIYTEEETVITYFSTKVEIPEIPKEVNIGSTEKSVVEQLGKGKEKGNTRTYCNEDEIDCVRFQFKKKQTERIEWLPYTG
jgi:hypothetical protein